MGQSAEDWLEQGRQFFQAGNYDRALESIAQSLAISDRLADAWNVKGAALKKLNRFQEALDSYDRAIALDPCCYKAWSSKAKLLVEQGCDERAIACYETALNINPNLPEVRTYLKTRKARYFLNKLQTSRKSENWLNHGNQKLTSGDFQGAIASYDRAIAIKPDYPEAWNNRGWALSKSSRKEDAIADYDQATTLKPDFRLAWLNRGEALSDLGYKEEVIANYDQAIAIVPDFHEAWYSKGIVLSDLGYKEEAIASYDQAIAIKSDYYEAWLNRSNELLELERNEEALASCNQAIEIRSDCHMAWLNRSKAMLELDRNEEALANCDQALEINSDCYEAWLNRSKAMLELDRNEEALASCDQALEINSNRHEAWANRGLALHRLGCYEEAINNYDQLLQINPDDYNALHDRGDALGKLEQYEAAIDSYNQALEINLSLYATYNDRGIILEKLGHYEAAIASYDQALQLRPDRHEAWVNRALTFCVLDHIRHLSQNLPFPIQKLGSNQHDDPPHITSLLQGQPYFNLDTEDWGKFHLALGDAYHKHAKHQQAPRSYWCKANDAYHIALPILANHSAKSHLKVLQGLMRTSLLLGYSTDANIYRETALQVFRDLLNTTPSAQKRQLEIQFSTLSHITVDVLVQSGQPLTALETADRHKNRCLNWILEDWKEQVWSPAYTDIQRLLTPDRAIIYWHLSPDTLTTFLLQPNAPEPIVSTQPSQDLENWIKTWNKDYQDYRTKGKENTQHRQTHPWRTTLKSRLTQLQTILQIPTLEPQLESITQLILIPHRQLHQLPLHSLFNDRFTTTYLPSLQVGLNLQQRADDAHPTHQTQFLSVENPLNDLVFAQIESVVVQQMFQQTTVLDADAATPQAVQNALENCHGFHFTGHGAYHDRQPQNSALTLANHQSLTAQTIQGLNLQPCQLVCLSACETALTGTQSLDTEYVGLVSAFLQAKAAAVVSTLWTVEEVSNAWLVIYFYSQLVLAKQPPILAMQQAQQWLQTVTYPQLVDWLQHQVYPRVAASIVAEQITDEIQFIQQDPGKIESQTPPYQDPYYWAAFTFTGLFTDRQSA
jgi:tetratricopeptide (TPR) repeat protein